jgi:hypothetical protein
MSDQTPGQRLLACFSGDPYLRGDYPESCGYCGSARAEPHQADCEWDAAREAAAALATLTASLASLEREREDWMQRAKDYRAALLQEKAECDHLRSEVARLTTAPEKAEP